MYYEYYEARWLTANFESTDWLTRKDDLHRKLVSPEEPKWNKMASCSRNRFDKWLFVVLVITRFIGKSSNSFKAKQKIPVFSAVFEMTSESNHAISFVNAFLTGSQKCWWITLSIFSQLETRKVLVLAGETKRGISLLVCVTPSRFPRDWR